jgi:hypothetical protein
MKSNAAGVKNSWVLVFEAFIGITRNHNRLGNYNLHLLYSAALPGVLFAQKDMSVTLKIAEWCRSSRRQVLSHTSAASRIKKRRSILSDAQTFFLAWATFFS